MSKLFKKRQPQNPPAVIPPITDLPLSGEQTGKALTALVYHASKLAKDAQDESDLLAGEEGGNEDMISLVVTLKRATPREKHKPILIPLPHPLLDPKQSPVCLFVKDPQREYKDLLAEKGVGFIARVVGISKLRGKHAPFEARRQLQRSYSLFLADKRIIPLLPPLLGNAFMRTKSLPIPVEIRSPSPSLKAELEQAVGGTTLRLSAGTCLTVKIGSLSRHSVEEVRGNLETVATHLAAKLPLGGWANVQALHVKSGTSVALPIWNCGLDESKEGRFSGETEEEKVGKAKARETKEKSKKDREERKRKRQAGVSVDEEDEAPAPIEEPAPSKKAKVAASTSVPPSLLDTEVSLIDGTPVVSQPFSKSSKSKRKQVVASAPPEKAEAGSTSGLSSTKSKVINDANGVPGSVTTEEAIKVSERPKPISVAIEERTGSKEGKKKRKKSHGAVPPSIVAPPPAPAVLAKGEVNGAPKGPMKGLAIAKEKKEKPSPNEGEVATMEIEKVTEGKDEGKKKRKEKEGKAKSSTQKKAKGTGKLKA